MNTYLPAAGFALLIAMLARAVPLEQERFKAIVSDALTPSLRIVTVLDSVQNACYLLFMSGPNRPAGRRSDTARSDLADATASRDRHLAALVDAYEQGFKSQYPGTPPLSALRFEWEGWKIQSEYERALRQAELARLWDEFSGIVAPAIAVSGPVPCGTRHLTSSSTGDQR